MEAARLNSELVTSSLRIGYHRWKSTDSVLWKQNLKFERDIATLTLVENSKTGVPSNDAVPSCSVAEKKIPAVDGCHEQPN